jgi:hypothetical protein
MTQVDLFSTSLGGEQLSYSLTKQSENETKMRMPEPEETIS